MFQFTELESIPQSETSGAVWSLPVKSEILLMIAQTPVVQMRHHSWTVPHTGTV